MDTLQTVSSRRVNKHTSIHWIISHKSKRTEGGDIEISMAGEDNMRDGDILIFTRLPVESKCHTLIMVGGELRPLEDTVPASLSYPRFPLYYWDYGAVTNKDENDDDNELSYHLRLSNSWIDSDSLKGMLEDFVITIKYAYRCYFMDGAEYDRLLEIGFTDTDEVFVVDVFNPVFKALLNQKFGEKHVELYGYGECKESQMHVFVRDYIMDRADKRDGNILLKHGAELGLLSCYEDYEDTVIPVCQIMLKAGARTKGSRQ